MQPRLHLRAAVFSVVLLATTGAAAFAQTADVTLKVGVIPISDVAPLYLGVSKGFFKEEHLAIEPVPAQGGAAIVPAVLSGDDQIGFSNAVSMILAASHGLPIQAVINGSQVIDDGAHTSAAVMVSATGPVKTFKDMEGKTASTRAK
jgi:NitT/TauT family transport system substrate-binding protein